MSEQEPNVKSITPPDFVFARPKARMIERVEGVGHKLNIFERGEINPDVGMLLHYVGVKFPRKGFPYMEAMVAVNTVKRNVMMIMKTLARREMLLPLIGFAFLPYKKKISLIEAAFKEFHHVNDYVLSDHFLQDKYMTPCARELKKFISFFFYDFGISFVMSESIANIFSTLIQYDDAYRYRIQDFLKESQRIDLLYHPRREIKKIIARYASREVNSPHIIFKFKAFEKFLSLALFSRKVRKSYKMALRSINFTNLQMDQADEYHCLNRADYNFGGKTIEYRLGLFEEYHKGEYPPMVEMS